MNGYIMFGEWTETGCHTRLRNVNRVGNETNDDTSKDFSTVGRTRVVPEA